MLNKERLKKRRKEMRLSQKQVASLIGRTQQSYQILETKDTSFTKPKTLEKIAKVLDTTVEYLTDTEILPMYQSLTEENKQKALEFIRTLTDSSNISQDN
ncbi:helix-turn-helix domain-containing protein [Pseudolactococcus laudensis]|jgi:transcriptional regulator with XRE-family HTH domain|uniref:helix-turn-helix domain-containing protein n=1 Tax=Pseudolactococcus laudensis TaxID=1494461 RepID=UPI000D218B42|nr:helix-turn-helix transcriptional regulator [Methanobrevibacter sp.]NCB81675.1 XRE family transcriptional regulator [Bacilli bacterium]SPC38466.1 protein of unknown function [Lactococcus piscium]